MADEPDNLVLRMLREIRGKLDEHDQRFDSMDQRLVGVDGRLEGVEGRLGGIEKQLEDLNFQMTYSLGIGAAANLKVRETDARLDDHERRLRQLEEPEPQGS